ncbi:MAG: hypothetical protein ACRC14_09615, partial [Paracoccaceae bacterium]
THNVTPYGLLPLEKRAILDTAPVLEMWLGADNSWMETGLKPLNFVLVYRTVPAPLVMPVYPWDDMIPEIQWCAVDADGLPFGYNQEPLTGDEDQWGIDGPGWFSLRAFACYVPGTVDWRNSLQQRPVKS